MKNLKYALTLIFFCLSAYLIVIMIFSLPDWPVRSLIDVLFIFILTGIVFISGKINIKWIASDFILKNGFYFLCSILLTAWFFITLPHTLFDDSGFTLRYLDNFAKGYFYTFNPADGPVFGISGFLNLIFCFLIKKITSLPSGDVLLISNLLGLFASSFILLKILNHFFKSPFLVFFVWISTFLTSKHFINVAFSGIETPFHLAIILLSFYFTLKNNLAFAFLTLSLSILSKLDAVASVVVLFSYILIANRKMFNKNILLNKLNYSLFLYLIIPFLLYFLVTILLFGSPLPQSAFAKVFHYEHPKTSLFPFLEPLIHNLFSSYWLIVFLLMFLLSISLYFSFHKVENPWMWLLSSFIAISFIILYFVYNPAEKMMWYYAIPMFFVSFFIFQTLGLLFSSFEKSVKLSVTILAALLLVFIRTDINKSVKWMKKSLNIVENERILIGEYLGKISKEEDILLSKHGHISRYFKGYVIDNSGLNSKLATRYHLSSERLIADFHPDFVIHHAYPDFVSVVNQFNYRIKNAFYDLTLSDSPNWILFEENQDQNKYYVMPVDIVFISGYEKKFDLKNVLRLRGRSITIQRPDTIKDEINRLIYGAVRFQYPYRILLKFCSDKMVQEKTIMVKKIGSENEISRFVQTISVEIPAYTEKVIIETLDRTTPVTLINPFWEMKFGVDVP